MRKRCPSFQFALTGDNVDPDGLINTCMAVMTAGTTGTENGVDLWLSEKGEGRKDPPNFNTSTVTFSRCSGLPCRSCTRPSHSGIKSEKH